MGARTTFLATCLVWWAVLAANAQGPWRKAFGAFGQDEAQAVVFTSSGDIVVAGSTGSFGNGSSDAYLLKLSGAGDLLWSHPIGGPQIDRAEALLELADGTLLMAGYSNSGGNGGYDGWLVKADAEGVVLWERYYGGSGWDLLYDLDAAPDGGAFLTGVTYSDGAGGADGWLLRVDVEGEPIWVRTLGGENDEVLHSGAVTSDAGVVVAGSQWSPERREEVYIVKLGADGSLQWERAYGTDSTDFASDIIETMDGGFSVVGTTRGYADFNEHLHLKLSAVGDSLWSHNWGQINDQEATGQVEMPSGEIYTVGYTETSGGGAKDMFIYKSTSEGDFVFQRTFGGEEDDIAEAVAVTPDGFILAGRTNSFGAGGDDVVIVRTDADCGPLTQEFGAVFDPVAVEEIRPPGGMSLFPNPATTSVRLSAPFLRSATVTLFDPQGRAVRTWSAPVPPELELGGLAAGTYQLQVVGTEGHRMAWPLVIAGY